MTTEKHKLFCEGRVLWQQYLTLNDYSFAPTDKGLRALAEKTGIKIGHVRKCINTFLEA